jgi:hypothetical protein
MPLSRFRAGDINLPGILTFHRFLQGPPLMRVESSQSLGRYSTLPSDVWIYSNEKAKFLCFADTPDFRIQVLPDGEYEVSCGSLAATQTTLGLSRFGGWSFQQYGRLSFSPPPLSRSEHLALHISSQLDGNFNASTSWSAQGLLPIQEATKTFLEANSRGDLETLNRMLSRLSSEQLEDLGISLPLQEPLEAKRATELPFDSKTEALLLDLPKPELLELSYSTEEMSLSWSGQYSLSEAPLALEFLHTLLPRERVEQLIGVLREEGKVILETDEAAAWLQEVQEGVRRIARYETLAREMLRILEPQLLNLEGGDWNFR